MSVYAKDVITEGVSLYMRRKINHNSFIFPFDSSTLKALKTTQYLFHCVFVCVLNCMHCRVVAFDFYHTLSGWPAGPCVTYLYYARFLSPSLQWLRIVICSSFPRQPSRTCVQGWQTDMKHRLLSQNANTFLLNCCKLVICLCDIEPVSKSYTKMLTFFYLGSIFI